MPVRAAGISPSAAPSAFVIPAQAGIHALGAAHLGSKCSAAKRFGQAIGMSEYVPPLEIAWIPARAGMTEARTGLK